MNAEETNERRRQLDRLVDGELPSNEYRELLNQLEQQPDGWRDCAMAFLESHAWQQDFGMLRNDDLSSRNVTHRPHTEQIVNNSRAKLTARVALAIAATIAIGFSGGVWWQSGQATQQEFRASELADNTNDAPQPSHADIPQPLDHDSRRREGVPTEHLTFVVDRADGKSDRFELPVYEANDQIARQLLQDHSPMPKEVERELRNSGFSVRNQREWTPVRLRDGRRAFFPVDQLDITPVSRSTYQ